MHLNKYELFRKQYYTKLFVKASFVRIISYFKVVLTVLA
jgi:hypothetical protein